MTDIYLAFDGGSGYDFWLPHLSPNDIEVASKVIEKVHTQPLKVMNGLPVSVFGIFICFLLTSETRQSVPSWCSLAGLVHGDLRSHVILSPPCVIAGSSHVCEAIMIVMNTAYEEHGNLPRVASVQLDNASPNHSMLVFSFCAQYVLFNVVDKFRVRFELASRPVASALCMLFDVMIRSICHVVVVLVQR